MRKLAILAAMGIALAAPVAHAAHWERAPNGAWVCRGSYPGIGAQGQLIEVCPPDPITAEQRDMYLRDYNKRTLDSYRAMGLCDKPADERPPICGAP